ncbi:Crp/Fnr family transcriptional regulator [Rhodospira trueperi]|uniref:Crp/Fnr family transcriptional regulator n=1 Tax=Rhodospira trueperi TaxID=69960 RepID=UPI001C40964E|nr:Crp/Fnr family transcriptional regulator [Rhodospira trueperi]
MKGNTLLGSLSADVLAQVETQCRWRHLSTNDVVFDQDDSSRDVFFIVSGRLRILVFRGPAEDDPAQEKEAKVKAGDRALKSPSASDKSLDLDSELDTGLERHSTQDSEAEAQSIKAGLVAFEALVDEGAPMTLTELGAGDTFGELSAIDGRMRSARAVALEQTEVAILDGESFVRLVQGHGDLALALLRRVAGYLRASNRRMYSLSTLTAKQRVYAQIARLAEVNPHRRSEWIIDPLPSHVDIAFWAGTKRETVAAAIGWLAREGIVARQHRALLVRDPDRLKALAHV